MSGEDQLLDSLKQVTIELRGTRERLRQLEERETEPIAIVGMSCRFPGGVDSPDDLWDLVARGGDAISDFPSDRGWPLDRLFHPDPDNPGTSYVSEGAFLRDVANFDAAFFGVHPGEAEQMDPQMRLLLEGAWEAIEAAGLDPADLRGTRTGVFAGLMQYDYGRGSAGAAGVRPPGADGGILSGYIAYALGLEGQAMSVDTACSSSLVAIHLATRALRRGECSLALAGGASVTSTPDMFISMSKGRTLAPDGRCKAFGEGADGVGWSEGSGVLLLQRLSDAEHDGNDVLALIRGSAVNQDGASNGFTAPNGPSQERVIRQALADAGLGTTEVEAVEAHGTGTPLGDPIEARALLATYGRERGGSPLWLGSLKSNLGHAQAAAGVGGVIKMVMALRRETLPPTLHVDTPTSQVDWTAGEVELLIGSRPWSRGERARRAGVSSFGAGGTNAHLIVEEAPVREPEPAIADDGAPTPFVLSAKNSVALEVRARQLRSHLQRHPDLPLADVAGSLALRRPHFERRAVVTANAREDLLHGLGVIGRDEAAAEVASGRAAAPVGEAAPVFLFPGHGSQWPEMTVGLIDESPIFARAMAECVEALSPHIEWSLDAVLRRREGAPRLSGIEVVQPALFAVMVSLAALWRAHGVEPAAVVGHSQGEIAAAYVAGGFSLDDAAALVARRSQILALGTGKGGMAFLGVSTDALTEHIPTWRDRVSLAVINGPASIVVSGPDEALDELLAECEPAGIWAKRVRAAVGPGHSPLAETIRDQLLDSAAGIVPRSAEIPFYSSLEGGPVDTARLDADYWYRNARETVRFGPTVQRAIGDGHRRFVEVSPHPILAVSLQEAFTQAGDVAAEATFTASLNRDDAGLGGFTRSLGAAWTAGVKVDWEAALPHGRAGRAPLPTYPFQGSRYWVQPRESAGDPEATGQAAANHPLLGATLDLAEGAGRVFTGRLSLETHPWLADHGGLGVVLLPGAAFVELALHAGKRIGCGLLRELTLEAPLLLPEQGAMQIQLRLSEPEDGGERTLDIYSRPEEGAVEGGGWIRNAFGVLTPGAAGATDFDARSWPPAAAAPVDLDGFYGALAAAGIEYGATFQGLTAAWRHGEELYAEIALRENEETAAASFCLHPALLDAAIHSAANFWLQGSEDEGDPPGLQLPFAFSDVSVKATGASRLRVRLKPCEDGGVGVAMADDTGAAIASIGSFAMRPLPNGYLAAERTRNALLALDWVPVDAASTLPFEGRIVAVGGGLGDAGLVKAYADLGELSAAIDAGAAVPEVVVVAAAGDEETGDDLLGGARKASGAALRTAQEWLLNERFSSARLAFLSIGAVATDPGEELTGLAQSPVWGLIRSAQTENPGRFVLFDLDRAEAAEPLLSRALSLDEPSLAIREGKMLAPRLRRPATGERASGEDPWLLDGRPGTVLVTGGTGDLGGLVARHLVVAHGASDLLLVSRSGGEAEGAGELRRELEELGARVRIVACDVGDRDELAALIRSIDPDRPLAAVVHTAAILDDGVLGSLSEERLDRVFAAKASAAWHLHELTAGMDLSAFVLFSSAAATVGNPGQASYAAANAFLDALAAHREAAGLAATSVAWGLWRRTLERVEKVMRGSDISRLSRSGLAPIGDEQGLELLDAAVAHERPALAPIGFDFPALRAEARKAGVAPVLRDLVRIPADRQTGAAGKSLAKLLAGRPEGERMQVVLEFVRAQIAELLGLPSVADVDPGAPFLELGFDSLTALEFRNRLVAASGIRLAPGIAFDHPTCEALAEHLADRIDSHETEASVQPAVLTSLFRTAHESGRTTEFVEVLREAAAFRPRFAVAEEGGAESHPLLLAEGPERPRLVCLPSAAPISGPHEYARLAKSFQGARDVLALRWPGFEGMEALPATMAAAVEMQAAVLAVAGDDSPIALVGHSTGGVFAHALAGRLEELDSPPAAVVLIDSYHPRQGTTNHSIGLGILGELLKIEESGIAIDDVRLTAMAGYLQLVTEFEPAAVVTPMLLVRATEPIGDGRVETNWQPCWNLGEDVIEVRGNHLTMVDAFADATAEAISGWLGEVLERSTISSTHVA